MRYSSSKDCMLGNWPECLKAGVSLSDFKADVDLISFLIWQRVEKKIVKVNQTMPFGQVIRSSNLKRHIYRKCEQFPGYNKYVDYNKSYNNTQQDDIQSAYFGHQTLVFLLPVYITLKLNKSIWRRSLSQ